MKEAVGELTPQRILLYFAVLTIMFLIGAVVLSSQSQSGATTANQGGTAQSTVVVAIDVAATSVSGSDAGTVVARITPTIALATPWGVLGLDVQPDQSVDHAPEAPTPLPDRSPIVLLGPPADSQFGTDDLVTFYWDWPEPLVEGQRFSAYVQTVDDTLWIGSAEADNLGTLQQLGFALGEVGAEAGSYVWYIVVEDIETGTVLARSEQRPIVLLPDPN